MPIDASGNALWPTSGRPPYTDSRTLVADTPLTGVSGRGVFIAATAAGNVRLQMSGGGFVIVPVGVGPNMLDDWSIRAYTSSGTTATVVVSVLL